jgi:geranylgeranyl reductase
MDTLLVERDFSFVKPCGGGIPSTALPEMGIPEKPVRKHVHALRVVSPGGDTLNVKLDGGSIAIVERGDFDHVLRTEAERSGARLLKRNSDALRIREGR